MATPVPQQVEEVVPRQGKRQEQLAAPAPPSAEQEIGLLVSRAQDALKGFQTFTQAEVDAIVKAMALAGVSHRLELARMAVDETHKGVFEDKVIKNQFATEYIYNDIKNLKTVGVIAEDPQAGTVEIAEPVGIIAGITPVTNPTSTTMFKAISALKARNPIIFAFHPQAQQCSAAAARLLRDAAVDAGAPAHCIQWIEHPSVEATNALMQHPGIALILATGGGAMVKAAYSSGKPALGVGPGNVPVYIEHTADINMAVNDILMSKTFDNGMICASEQSVIIDEAIAEQTVARFISQGAYVLNPAEVLKVEALAIDSKKCAMSPAVVGQPATKIAEMAGITVPAQTKVLIAPLQGVGPETPLSREKLSPILGLYTVKTTEEAFALCEQLLQFGGLGHTAGIFTNNPQIARAYGQRMPASRVLVNAPTSFGGIGDLYNTLVPSLTLGCGSYGGNSTSENVSVRNLLNIKRVSKRKERMKWFKVPPKIFFEKGCLAYLRQLDGERAIIIADPAMVKLGYVKQVERYLADAGMTVEIFSEIEPDPTTETLYRGVERMRHFQPDTIVAFGGGS
ncbi:MAG TPA: aldehyde dehydrogenase family protein, partial [Armatimonadota bacterium]